MSFTVRGRTRIPAGELREAELTWYSVGERGGPLGEPLDGDFHLRVEAKIRAGLRRPVALPDGTKVRAALDDEDAARATLLSLFEPGHVIEDSLTDAKGFDAAGCGNSASEGVERRTRRPIGGLRPHRRGSLRVVQSYLLQVETGDPADPAVFVDDEDRTWEPGDSFYARDGSQWRIVAIDAVSAELAAEGFEATWIVEPLD